MDNNANCWKQAYYITSEINLEAPKTNLESIYVALEAAKVYSGNI